jgi:hypothetical protein
LLAILNGRIYRAAFVPLLVAVAVAALSLENRPPTLTGTVAPDAFDGGWTAQELQTLGREYPRRDAGSAGDDRLAWQVAQSLQGLGGAANGGFHVSVRRTSAETVDGERSLLTVVAARPGTTSESPIIVLAHRDAGGTGSRAALSGTAVLLELARVLANEQTNRTVVLVSTSGGSGGAGGAADFAGLVQGGRLPWMTRAETAAGRSVDAAIVLGDLASASVHPPLVIPYSSGLGTAPVQLSETAASAISQQAGLRAGSPSFMDQLVHLAAPLTAGEQGPLNAAGVPAVLIQASGERGPTPASAISVARMESLGGAVLATMAALDGAPDVEGAPQTGLVLAHKIVPEWAVRVVVAALLLPALLVAIDALARVRRRREPVARWIGFTLACGTPFLVCGLLVALMGAIGLASPAIASPAPRAAVHLGAAAWVTMVIALLALATGCLAWPAIVRALGLTRGPLPAAAGVAFLLVLDAVALVTWVGNPFAALLMVPAAHIWLLVAAPELRPRRAWLGMGLVLLGVCAPALVVVYYANQLGGGTASLWMGMLLVAGGHIGPLTVVLWSLALGCVPVAAIAALSGRRAPRVLEEPAAITIRGPLSYAGPGSLGGTESALRR